jgi:hypothetical protein
LNEAIDLAGRLAVAVDKLARAESADDLRTRSRSPSRLAAQLDVLLTKIKPPDLQPASRLQRSMEAKSQYMFAQSSLDSLRRLLTTTESGARLGVVHADLLTEAAQAIHKNIDALVDLFGNGRADG